MDRRRKSGVAAGEAQRLEAMLTFEREARANGFLRVAGVDEAGRGPFAGPLVAAAVVLAEPVAGVDDSKRLTAVRREALFETLLSGTHAIGVAIIEARAIDRMGLQQANYSAMLQAALAITPPPDFLLVDGFAIRGATIPQLRLIRGDSRSLSIAAASIVAKVTRDRIMNTLDAQYPGYGFARHKGYGTKEHIEALNRLGPSPVHRLSFAPVSQRAETSLLFETGDEA